MMGASGETPWMSVSGVQGLSPVRLGEAKEMVMEMTYGAGDGPI